VTTASSAAAAILVLAAGAGLSFAAASASATASSNVSETPVFVWHLPAGFPVPRVPADNPMSEAKVALGRRLFYDRRLSLNGRQACADCHRQERAFTDGAPHATGSTGAAHRRNVPTLANVAYEPALTWADPRHRTLEEQARVPLFGTEPVEMGFGGREEDLIQRLAEVPLYRDGFAAVFPGEPASITVDNLTRALACFERTLVSGGSPYDRLVYGDEQDALSPEARRGMRLFFSEKSRCAACHGGVTFTGVLDYAELERVPRPRFLDDGLSPSGFDAGLEEATGRRRDRGRFKVPTLRNIALTAPYMHDGRLATLGAVLDHYATVGPDGEAVVFSDAERRDLLAFLDALTDRAFVSDARFADPTAVPGEPTPVAPETRPVSARTRPGPDAPEGCGGGCSRSKSPDQSPARR
jgi:cytochrome c peroxidase